MRTRLAIGAALAVALAACGGSVDTGPGTGGSGGTGGGGTGGSGGLCAGFEDEAGAGSVTVRFRNETGQPIFLPSLCGGISYSIDPTTPPDGLGYVFDGSCLQTCEDLQTQPQYACGACQETTFRIDPGSTREVQWAGTGIRSGVAMPAACWNSPGPGQCSEIVAAAAGTYRATAVAYDACEGDCTCDSSGVCFGTATGAQAFSDLAKFDYPSANQVEVVFSSCAFGCPGGGL